MLRLKLSYAQNILYQVLESITWLAMYTVL